MSDLIFAPHWLQHILASERVPSNEHVSIILLFPSRPFIMRTTDRDHRRAKNRYISRGRGGGGFNWFCTIAGVRMVITTIDTYTGAFIMHCAMRLIRICTAILLWATRHTDSAAASANRAAIFPQNPLINFNLQPSQYGNVFCLLPSLVRNHHSPSGAYIDLDSEVYLFPGK